MERLRHRDDVERTVVEGNRLGGAVQHIDVGQYLGELSAHAGDRLHRDDVGAGRDEQAGELSRAGGEVAPPRAGNEGDLPPQEVDRLGRVGRSSPFVIRRRDAERVGETVDTAVGH